MNFRKWLINEELWTTEEGEKYDSFSIPRKIRYPIYKNPSPQELQNVMKRSVNLVRALLEQDDTVYIWPGDIESHDKVIDILDLDTYRVLHFYILPNGKLDAWGTENWPDWEDSPNIRSMMGDPLPVTPMARAG